MQAATSVELPTLGTEPAGRLSAGRLPVSGDDDEVALLRHTAAVTDGLPLPWRTFVGREREVRAVEDLLESHRVVT